MTFCIDGRPPGAMLGPTDPVPTLGPCPAGLRPPRPVLRGPAGGGRVELRQLLAPSVATAEAGGREVWAVRQEVGELRRQTKGGNREGPEDFLTAGDPQSHRRMTGMWAHAFPAIRDSSELRNSEIPADIQERISHLRTVPVDRRTVWIDPLDATQEYTEGLLSYVTTTVWVAVDGKPVIIGVIHKPFSGFTGWALVGEGANVSRREVYRGKSPRLIVSRTQAGAVCTFSQGAFGSSVSTVPARGAAHVSACLFVCFGGAAQTRNQDYRVLPPHDIRATRCHMTTLSGQDIDYRDSPVNKEGLIANVGLDHRHLVRKIRGLVEQRD
uniref:Inositol monophosphatase domain containing 1 n=1 Tax=Ornithorhynchus anatinus TaxID=9258 RepID=F7E1Q9_ORNAN